MRRSALLAVPLALALTGCNGSAGKTTLTTDFGAQLRASVTKTTNQSSKISLTLDTVAQGQTVTCTGDGAFGAKDGKRVGTFSMKVMGIQIEERVVGDTLYLQVPGQPGWQVLALKDLVGTSFETSATPSSAAQVLLAAGKDVTKVGTATVRGVKTTHYKGTIAVDGPQTAKLGGVARAAIDKLKAQGVTTLPFEAFLDAQGRLVRLVEKVALTVQGTKADTTTTVDLYDFGTAVSAAAPPKSEQHDGSAFLQQIKGALGG